MAEDEGQDKDKASKSAPPIAPPPIISQVQRREGKQWLAFLIYTVVALVVAAGVVLGGRWVYNTVRNDEPAKETAANNNKPPSPPATAGDESGTSSDKKKPSTTNNQRQRITNTGPGGTVALFVGTAIVATGLHYVYQLRRKAQGL